VRELIKSLAGKHTIILVDHILPEVVATCQRVLMIAQGKIVADDTLAGCKRPTRGAPYRPMVRWVPLLARRDLPQAHLG